MANLIKLSNDLEYVPKEQLIEMSQNPDSNYPSYLVLAEIQRRTQMEKMYAAQQPQPETTVAEELVQEYASSPQGLGAMAQTSGANPSTLGAEGNMAPPSPMQMMASGGRTGYQVGGSLGISGDSLSQTFTNPTPSGSELVSDTFTESPQTKFGAAGEMILDAGSDVVQWAKNNPVDAAIIGVSLVPGIGWLAGAGLRTISAARKAMKGKNIIKSMYSKSKPIDVKTTTTPKILGNKNPLSAADDLGYGSGSSAFGKITPDRVFDPKRFYGSMGLTYGTKQLYDYGMSPAEEQPEPLTEDERIAKKVAEEMAKFRKNQSSNDINTSNVETTTKDRKGLGNFLPNADPSMLIGLGGAIMGANTIGELGKGISEVALGERAREDAQKLTGLQGRMMEAQIAKYEADVANMSVQQIIAEMNAINKGVESGAMQVDDELRAYMVTLSKELEKQRNTGTGYAASEAPTGGDMGIFEKTKIPA